MDIIGKIREGKEVRTEVQKGVQQTEDDEMSKQYITSLTILLILPYNPKFSNTK